MTFSRKVTCPYCREAARIPAEAFNDDLLCGSCGRAIFAAKPTDVTAATFAETIAGSEIPVLVDFWAAWCGPCRAIAPSIEALAGEFAGRAVVAKLNIDENPRTAQRFNVMSIPTLLIFKNGKVVDTVVGAQPLPALRQELARHV